MATTHRQQPRQGARARLPLAQAAGDGVHATIDELAAAERINPSYVSLMLRLTLLVPDIDEASPSNTSESHKKIVESLCGNFCSTAAV